MAVLIRGMNMPQCCAECGLENYLEGIGENACPAVYENACTSGVRETGRLPHCPLEEIKELTMLPCPRCGTARPETLFSWGKAGVRCRQCGLEAWSKTEIGAIRAWNDVVIKWTE